MSLLSVLPPRRVHLLGGVSDAGKTRFVVPAMASCGVPWAYVAGDRTMEDAQDTIKDMGIDSTTLVMIPGFGKGHKTNWFQVAAAIDSLAVQPHIVVVEGFQDFCPGLARKHEVRNFLGDVHCYLEERSAKRPEGFTLLGIVESPKLKPNERYSDARQRISGVSAWGYHSSTVLLIESVKEDGSLLTPERRMFVCTKGAGRREIRGAFTPKNQLVFPTL